MKTIYHVAPENHSGALLSLYALHGSKSYEMYADRWPESGNLAEYHAHYVHCFTSLDEAKDHVLQHGGKIYAIDAEAMIDDYHSVEVDSLEFAHPMVRDEIPEEYIKAI